MILNKQQQEKLVIDLLNQGFTYPQIAKRAHVSFSEIKRIELMVTGDDKKKKEEDEVAEKGKKAKSIHCQAFELFLEGRSPVQVAIDLELETDKAMAFLYDFMRLQNMHRAAKILKEYKDHLAPFVTLFEWLRKNNTRVKDIRYAVDNVNEIKSLEQQKESLKKEVESIKGERDYLLDNLGGLQRKYS
jgi:hypothetical protein